MASIVAPGLVQAYVEKKLHEEKMKRMKEEVEGSQDSQINDEYGKKKRNLFGLLKKKVHHNEFPNKARSSMD
ncbi:hypothetical protein M5K25_023032 [Dendrobium thyrsiflorum]|uniref:Uncharacterized protein n=1 Tax=Dendrobium thyrsiflorum TaxID=117978 RepID=A0ABD0U7J0_DENTH